MKNFPQWRLILGFLIFCSLYLVFYPSISQMSIVKELVLFFTVDKNRKWVEAFTFIFLVACLAITVHKFKSRPKVKLDLLNDFVLQSIVITVYLLHRLKAVPGQEWEFQNLIFLPSVYYMDIVVFSLVAISYNPKLAFSDQEKHVESLIEDNYYQKTNADVFDRKAYASTVADLIKNQKVSRAFAIAITGKWGSGKTVFLEQIAENINKRQGILIRFNPWLTRNPALLTEDFFSMVYEHVKPYSGQISRNVRLYSQALLNLEDNTKVKVSKFLGIQRDSTLEKIREDIQEGLAESQLKLVIFIEDLDRLNAEEVLAVMTLVRNSFNFPNVYFLVAYDHDYICGLLGVEKVHNPPRYLEKIFSMEIELPSFPLNILKPALIDLLESNKNEVQKAEIRLAVEELDNTIGFNAIVRNLRECVRLANSFNHVYQLIYPQVDVMDFLLLEIIKIRNRQLYNIIKNDISFGRALPFFRYPETEIDENIIFQSMEGPHLNTLSKEDQILLDKLFNRNKFDNVKAVRIFDNFLRYFSTSLFGYVSFDDFYSYKDPTPEKFLSFVERLTKDHRINAGKELFLRSNAFNNKTDFKNFILGYIKFVNESKSYNLGASISSLITDNRKLFATLNEFEEFLNEVLSFSAEPNVEAFVGNSLLYANTHSFDEEYRFNSEVVFRHLRRYLQNSLSGPEIKIEKWSYLYQQTLVKDLKLDSESVKIVQEYIRNNNCTYLNSVQIHKQSGLFLDAYIPTYLSWDDFEKLLYECPENFHILQLKCFFKVFKLHSYQPVSLEENEFYLASDEETLFEVSPTYPHIRSGHSRLQVSLNEIHNTSDIIPLKYSYWIAHEQAIAEDEERRGGKYQFKRTFNLNSDSKRIIQATLYFMVDDEMTFMINGISTGETYKQNKQHGQPFQVNVLNMLNSDTNTLVFNVINKTLKVNEVVFEQSKTNPYGFIYGLLIKYEDKRSNK